VYFICNYSVEEELFFPARYIPSPSEQLEINRPQSSAHSLLLLSQSPPNATEHSPFWEA